MRVSIRVAPSDSGWNVTYDCATIGALAPRELRRVRADSGETFPLPPLSEKHLWSQPHRDLCDATDGSLIESMVRDIILADPSSEAVANIGRYLAAVLLGPHWTAIVAGVGQEPIELRLELPDAPIQRLPWELMYGVDKPLAGDDALTVAIVRVVPRAAVSTRELALPLRVLFVVGSKISSALLPGAEYVGLLGRNGNASMLHSRTILEASTDEVTQEVARFRPSVVHFICHGDSDGARPVLKLTAQDSFGVKTGAEKKVTPEELLEILRVAPDGALPPVVVVNACHTSDVSRYVERKQAYCSYAASLVRGGVKIAVGMAGEVTDSVCRLFTRSFYEAIRNGKAAAVASTKGRRAAMHKYGRYGGGAEWARPALFVGDDVDPAIALVVPRVDLAVVADRFVTMTSPRVLCDRMESMRAYELLREQVETGKGQRYVLAFGTTEAEDEDQDGYKKKFGKSRLLEEIAARAVLDGFVPVVMEKPPNEDRPGNLLEFAVRLNACANVTRERFGKQSRQSSAAYELALDLFAIDEPTPARTWQEAKRRIASEGAEADPTLVRDAIRKDLRALVDDLTDVHPGGNVPMVLIDDLHLHEGILTKFLQLITDYGLGGPGRIVPLVFTYSRKANRGGELMELGTRKGVIDVPLTRFGDPEDLLAYRQYMLTRAREPLAVNRYSPILLRDRFDLDAQLRAKVLGLPSRWETPEMRSALSLLKTLEVLVDADDTQLMDPNG